MALITCPDCKKEISDKAVSCPNCGRPMQVNHQTENTQNTNIHTSNTPSAQNAIPQQNPKKKGRGCLTTILIVFLLFCVCVFFGVSQGTQNTSSITGKYIDVTDEEGLNIDAILESCGITAITSIEHDVLLDNAHSDGETGYRIAVNGNVDNIILYLNADKIVYSIKYAGYDLYADNSVIATLQDYTFTSDEMSKLMVQCQSKIEEILQSPSTAKFPNILEWEFGKEKNIVTVQGYVDSQNGFGTEIRSKFQFIIDTDTNTIKSFIFDGQELIVE